MPTPMIAVSSGRPAASSEPSVIASTRKPTIMPRLSELACDSSVTRPPPNSVWMPGLLGRRGRRLELVTRLVVDLVGRDRVDHVGEPDAPSFVIALVSYGLVTPGTSFACEALARLASTAALFSASVSFSPSGAANTSRA